MTLILAATSPMLGPSEAAVVTLVEVALLPALRTPVDRRPAVGTGESRGVHPGHLDTTGDTLSGALRFALAHTQRHHRATFNRCSLPPHTRPPTRCFSPRRRIADGLRRIQSSVPLTRRSADRSARPSGERAARRAGAERARGVRRRRRRRRRTARRPGGESWPIATRTTRSELGPPARVEPARGRSRRNEPF